MTSPDDAERRPSEGAALKTGDETIETSVTDATDNGAQADVSPALAAILDRVTDPTQHALADAVAAVFAISVLVADGEVTDDEIDDIDMHASVALDALEVLRLRDAKRWSA